jgi:hypothetical protein
MLLKVVTGTEASIPLITKMDPGCKEPTELLLEPLHHVNRFYLTSQIFEFLNKVVQKPGQIIPLLFTKGDIWVK